ncbi:MAG: fibronectin type III domain-containing protein [Alphaproteobacteria bacterium]|nr:fibronectin type III domain-containing protein [Alphaproteobacteria bacterium]
MKRPLVHVVIIAGASAGLLFSTAGLAQVLPLQKRAEHVEITKGPELESAVSYMAIVRWTTTNPRGLDEHYGIVYYGTNPDDLSAVARGHIRLNRAHPEIIFRVRLQGLEPKTTYYYRVTSVDSAGKSDGEESNVNHFTTPSEGQGINNYPQPK